MKMVRYGVMAIVVWTGVAFGQMLIPNTSPVTESFSLGTSGTATLPAGFVVSQGTTYTGTTTAATTLAYGNTGTGAVTSSSGGGTINWANGITASATDRALGFLNTGSFTSPRSIMLKIQNTTGGAIGSLTISFDYEKYRSGTRAFDWTFFSGSDGSTWTAQTAGDQSYAADAANTTISNPPLTTSKSGIVISGLNIANNGFYYLRWTFTGVGGSTNGQGIGIDNLSITAGSANSASSDIIANAGFTYPTNIAYASHTGTDVTSSNPELFEIDVRDGGASADADASATTLNAITFSVTNAAALNKVALYDGTTELGEVAAASSITFSGLTAAAADGASKTLNLRATFKSSVTDNTQVSFAITSATADAAGSTFAAGNAGGAASSTSGDNNRIEVTATDLIFSTDPGVVSIGASMSPAPAITAVDGNVNTDLDFTGTVTVTTTGTFDGGTTSVAAVAGVATFSNLVFAESGTGFTLAGTASGVNGTGNSVTFDVTNPQPEINVKQGVTAIANGGSYGFGSLTSGTSSSAVTFTIENIGTASLSLSGTPRIAVSGTNATEFQVDQTSTAASVAASGTTTFTVTFSPSTSGSKSASISIANNDATGSEDPYVINLSGTGTVSSASDIAATSGFTYPANIDYASYQSAASLTSGTSVGVMGVSVRDGGASADADNLSTTLTALSFSTGSSAAIRTAALFDGSTNISEVAVNGGTTIAFTGLSVAAADGGTKDLVLRVTFQSAVTDNQQIAFTVSSATASSSGSGFAVANAGAAASSVTGDDNRIEVTATKFNFSAQPSAAAANTNFSAAVEALDANNNRDLDATTSVTLSASAGTLASVTGLTQSLVAGLYSWTDLQNNTSGSGVTLSASGALTTATSNAFNIVASQPTAQDSSLVFSAIGMNAMTVSWTAGNGAARIVVVKAGGTPTTPTDGVTYTANSVFGSGGTIAANEYVVYNGSGTSVTVTGLTGSTSYTFKVFGYNGSGGTENYLTTSNAATQATTGLVYYSVASGDPAVLTNWATNRDGTGSNPANFTTGETFVIESGDNMTTTAAWSISGTNSKLQIENGGTLTANNAVTLNAASVFQVDNGGTYIHNNATSASTSIFAGTESFGASSMVKIQNWPGNTTVLTTGVTLPFGNLEINWTTNANNWQNSWSGTVNLCAGNLTILSVGTGTMRFTPSGAPTVTVAGNYTQSGGTVNLASSSGVTTFNVGGNVTISGGSLTSSSTGSKLVFNGTSQQSVTTAGLSSVPNIDIPVAGNVIVQDSLIYSGAMTVSGKLSFGTGTRYIGGTGSFTVNSGATLSLASVNGISTTSTAGNIRNSGSRSLSTAANYELITSGATTAGAHTQITGTGFPATVNNFTVNNTLATDSIFLTSTLRVNGTMTLTSGNLRTVSDTLFLGASASLTGEAAGRSIIGVLSATKTVGTAASTMGGIGLSLAAGTDDLGDVTVTRVTGTSGAVTVGANTGIHRKFTLSSVNAPAAGRALTLTWLPEEDNSKALASGTVWKSVNSGSTWTLAASGDYTTRSVTLPSETAFGQYTVSDVTSPLPVEIVRLTAAASADGITITWATASELNNHGFGIERSAGGKADASWTSIGFVEGKGTTNAPQEYSFTDATASGTVQYRLKQIDRDGHFTYSGIVEVSALRVVTAYGLDQNYPNPFNPGTRIAYQLLASGNTTLKVYDMLGKQVASLVNGYQSAGEHTVDFNAASLPSGIYFYTLRSGSFTSTRKMLLLK